MQGESLWRKDQRQLPLAWHPNPCLQLEQAACIQCQQEQSGELRWLSSAVDFANSCGCKLQWPGLETLCMCMPGPPEEDVCHAPNRLFVAVPLASCVPVITLLSIPRSQGLEVSCLNVGFPGSPSVLSFLRTLCQAAGDGQVHP